MSSFLSVDVRERWASRSMILKRWLVRKTFDPAEPVCEMEIDGVTQLTNGRQARLAEDEAGSIYRFFVAEGREVGPWGHLLEFTEIPKRPTRPDVHTSLAAPLPPLHASANLNLVRRPTYPKIFLSYRRDDADAYAGRLHEVLAGEFGEEEVFMAEFSIRGGEVWDWTIQQAVVHASVVLALIGQRWMTVTDAGGQLRIKSERDLVRREIVAAMDRGTTVIPVLLPDATIPSDRDFDWNDVLRLLPQLQMHRFTGARNWKADVQELIRTIQLSLGSN